MDILHDISISDRDFHRLVDFIQKNYGIDLSKKKTLITSRLSHSLRQRGYTEMAPFLEHLFSTKDPDDLELILNKLTTNYTYFLRETDHFTYFQNKILPELAEKHKQDKVLSIWSAGCSSGEHPSGIPAFWPRIFPSKRWPRPRKAFTRCPPTCPMHGYAGTLPKTGLRDCIRWLPPFATM